MWGLWVSGLCPPAQTCVNPRADSIMVQARFALFNFARQAQMKKARRLRQAFIELVAGAGFEPTTFGL